MSSVDKEKIDQLLSKVKGLGQRLRSTRDSLGQPVTDILLDRLTKLSSRLPSNGDFRRAQQPQPPEIPRRTCPKCGQSFADDIAFCSGCGFSFGEEKRRQQYEQDERQRLERNARASVIS